MSSLFLVRVYRRKSKDISIRVREKSASRQESVQTARIRQNLSSAAISLFGESKMIITNVRAWQFFDTLTRTGREKRVREAN